MAITRSARRRVGDVGPDGDGGAGALALDPGGNRRGSLAVEVGDDDAGAAGDEAPGDRPADPAAPAGHHATRPSISIASRFSGR